MVTGVQTCLFRSCWCFPSGTEVLNVALGVRGEEERVFEVRSVEKRADEAADALLAGAKDCPGAELL